MKIFRIDKKQKIKNFKLRKNKKKNFSYDNIEFKRGFFGLKSLNSGILTSLDFRNLNEYLIRHLKKTCKFWINYYPNFTITKKSIGVRMGKGKGKINTYGFFIKKGCILVELNNDIDYYKAKKLLKKYIYKLPLGFKFVSKKI